MTFPFSIISQPVFSDLRFRKFILIDFTSKYTEGEAIMSLQTDFAFLLKFSSDNHILQIQAKFPSDWTNFYKILESVYNFSLGLRFIEKKIDRNFLFPSTVKPIIILEDIKKLLIRQQNYHFSLDPSYFIQPSQFKLNEYMKYLEKTVENKNGIIYGLYKEKIIIGFIGLEKEEPGLYINELIVDENYRRQGIGKTLMKAAFAYAGRMKKEKIWTTLSARNNPALNFYLDCGFEPTAYRFYLNINN